MSDNLKALNQERYARSAENYVVSPVHAAGSGLSRLLELASVQSDWHVLDVATGAGHTALHFAPHVENVIAIDFTGKMLQAAQRFIARQNIENVIFCSADAEILPFVSAGFDLVTCRIAAHHFPDIFAFVREAYRLLKPGATLLVQDHLASDDSKVANFVNAFEKLRDPAHARTFAEYEWHGLFLDAGLTIEHSEQFTIEHELQSWAKRQFCSETVVEQLNIMLLRAPEAVRQWMQPQFAGTPFSRFTDHQIIIKGKKSHA